MITKLKNLLTLIWILWVGIIGCTSDSTDDQGIFPTPEIPIEDESSSGSVPVQIPVVNPPVVEVAVEEPVVKEPEPKPEPDPVEVEEKEPEDNTAPSLIESSISHGDIGVDPDTQRFVFTFDEEIDVADVKLINDTQKVDMQWTALIDGKRIILLRLPNEGRKMGGGELYTIQLRWSDAAGNWEPENFGIIRVITFVTEIKE